MQFPERTLYNSNREKIQFEHIEGKNLGLFFAASWCRGCSSFLPSLLKFYNFIKPANATEIIYVPFDQNEESYNSYVQKMPWLSLPYGDYKYMTKKYQIKGFPSLIFIDPMGKKISSSGVFDIRDSDPVLLDRLTSTPFDRVLKIDTLLDYLIWSA